METVQVTESYCNMPIIPSTFNIDILLATYNGERFLREQIDSILNQSYQDFHLIIRDDGSKDCTLAIVHDYIARHPGKITLIEDSVHRGAIGSFSHLLSSSGAPYVMFSDQDDVWLADKIQVTIAKMREMESLHGKEVPLLVHGDLIVVDQDLKVISESFWKYIHLKPSEGFRLNRIMVQNEVTGCTMMLNRPLADLAKPIAPESIMHDWWIGLVASACGHIGIVKSPIILYRQHGKNTLGARKYKTIEQIMLALKNRSTNINQKSFQAYAMIDRYEHILPEKNLEMISDYAAMESASILKCKYLSLKHRFFKHGIIRNLYCFFLKKVP